jgi:hypothetical protein
MSFIKHFFENKEWGAEYADLLPPKLHEFVVNHTHIAPVNASCQYPADRM